MSGDEVPLRERWIKALRSAPLTGDPRWSTATFAVAVALWMFANDDGESIRPSDARVGSIVNCSKVHARNKRRDLLSLGLIECVGEATERGMAPEYRLVPPERWNVLPGGDPAAEGTSIGAADSAPDEVSTEGTRCPNEGLATRLQCTLPRGHSGGCNTSRRRQGGGLPSPRGRPSPPK